MDYARILYSEISFKPKPINKPINGNTSINGVNNNHLNNINNKQHHGSNEKNKNGLQQQTNNHNSNNNSSNNNNNNHHSNNNDNSTSSSVFQLPKHQLCDPNLVKLDWMQPEKIGCGLINVGNTCFLNSVLQCLTYCPPLYNYLVKLDGGHSSSCKINQFCMLCEMEKHIKRIKNSNGSPIKPISIVQRLKYINKSFQFGRQEDAHEFLRYLIDHMWKACLLNLDININNSNNNSRATKIDPKIKETTFINHIFGGYHRSQILCLQCNSRSNTFDFFMDFMLDIRNVKSLEDALKKFTQSETLENENAYKCVKCKRKATAKKKFTVYLAPNVATFQLKRFDSDRIFGGKVTKFISYPEDLDLRPYMSDTTKSPIKYQLSAVLVHLGHSSNSGHYFCFIKNSNNLWYKMDDSSVTLVNKATVLQQQAYVLFYTRKSRDQKTPSNGIRSTITSSTSKNDAAPVTSNGTYASANNNNQQQNRIQLNATSRDDNKAARHNSSSSQLQNDTKGSNGTSSKIYDSHLRTWSGSKSELETDSTKRKLDETTERDLFNEELDQGKVKKIKSKAREERFSELAKINPFQRFNSNNKHSRYTDNTATKSKFLVRLGSTYAHYT